MLDLPECKGKFLYSRTFWCKHRCDVAISQGSRYVLRKGFPLKSYPRDGIETINPTLGSGLDS